VDEAERKQWHDWMRQLLAATVFGLPRRCRNPATPSSFERQAAGVIPSRRRLSTITDRRSVASCGSRCWRGRTGGQLHQYFLQGFMRAGGPNPGKEFIEGWKEILAWAEKAEEWKFTDKSRPMNSRGLV